MTKMNPYGYDPAQAQRDLVRVLTEALPRRGEPALAWEIDAEGLALTGRGSREAVRLAAGRIGSYGLRDQIEAGAQSVTHTIPVRGNHAAVTLTVTG
jgi:hypothetical protein